MSRWEFMRRLEELLSDISPSEREEALQYYNDYINDAGRENEEEAISSLGSPEQVARSVKEGLGDTSAMGEFTEKGFSRSGNTSQNPIVKREEVKSEEAQADTGWKSSASDGFTRETGSGAYSSGAETSGAYTGQTTGTAEAKEPMPTWAIVLIVIGCVILSPVLLGLAGSAFGVIISIIAAVFGLIIGVAAAAIALFIAGIALIVAGFGGLLTHPLVSIGLIGAGFVCLALGVLFVMLEVFLCGICLPGIFKGLAYIFKKIFGKKEVA